MNAEVDTPQITHSGLVAWIDIPDEELRTAMQEHATALDTASVALETAVKTIESNPELTGAGKSAAIERLFAEGRKELDRIERKHGRLLGDVDREMARIQKSIDTVFDEPQGQADATESQRYARLEAKMTGAIRASWILDRLAGIDPTMLELKLYDSIALNDRETLRAVLSVPPTFRLLSQEQAETLRKEYVKRHRPETYERLSALQGVAMTMRINANTVAKRIGLVPSVADVIEGKPR